MKPIELKETYLDSISKMDIPADLQEIREQLEELIVFDRKVFSSFSLSQDDQEILFDIGIPQEYQTAIVFEPEQSVQDTNEIRIGWSTAGGDEVYLKSDASIVLYNHDYDMKEIFIASNITCLFHFIIEFINNENPDLRAIDKGLEAHQHNFWYSKRQYQT
mgnify:CR=1 FL=1